MRFVTGQDISVAADRIAPVVLRTPLLAQTWAGAARPLWLKPESLQPVGSFKLRGACNALACLGEYARDRGVVTHSSGNHAQALAYAAREFGVTAHIVMPDSAPRVKIDNTRSYGAEVVLVPVERRESAAAEIAESRGAVLVPPYDDPHIIAGQGTVGWEIADELADVASVLVPISGGGLASGVGTAIKAWRPATRVIGVEPELAADTRDSLRAGVIREWPVRLRSRTVADGLRAQPSELTFAHLRAVLDAVVTVTEEEIRAAMAVAASRARLVAEPSGAVALAAYLYRGEQIPDGATVAVVSGGNVQPDVLAAALREFGDGNA